MTDRTEKRKRKGYQCILGKENLHIKDVFTPSTMKKTLYKQIVPKLPSISILPTFLLVLGVTVTARRVRLIYLSDTSANHNSKYKN